MVPRVVVLMVTKRHIWSFCSAVLYSCLVRPQLSKSPIRHSPVLNPLIVDWLFKYRARRAMKVRRIKALW
jgi:hypothetical protein